MSTIEKRLEKLESKLRFYQFAFICITFGAGFFIMTSFNKKPAADLIQAKEFQVLDDRGRVLVSIKKDSTGGGRLNVFNSAGTNVLLMHSAAKGGRISITDHYGGSGMVASVTEDENGILNVYNKSNKRICAVGGDAAGNGVLNVYNNAGANMNGVWPKQ